MAAIDVACLSKTYTYHHKAPGLRGSLESLFRRRTLERHAVERVTFSVEPGEIVGFLGPNGAGKTTTIKMLCGLLYPTSGEARVLGYLPQRRDHAFLRRIALVMGQKTLLWPDLPAMEMLLVHKELYGLSTLDFRRNLDELVTLLGVSKLLSVQVRKLSLGERMKMELTAALIHRPDVLFLDEPTIGLDVASQQRVRGFLRRLNAELGTTIILTSHYLEDVRELCPRALVIDHGRICFDGHVEAALSTLLRVAGAVGVEDSPDQLTLPEPDRELEAVQ
jgi:ABC-2 type transport system ATP-binding protein